MTEQPTPSTAIAWWRDAEPALRATWLDAGIPPAAIDFVLTDVRPRIEALALPLTISCPGVPDAELAALKSTIEGFISKVQVAAVFQIVRLSFSVWQAMNPTDPRPPKVVVLDTIRRHLAEAGATNTSPRRVA